MSPPTIEVPPGANRPIQFPFSPPLKHAVDVVVGATSHCHRLSACHSAALQPARLELERRRRSRTWDAVSASLSSSSTVPTRWTIEVLDESSKVGGHLYLDYRPKPQDGLGKLKQVIKVLNHRWKFISGQLSTNDTWK